MMRFPCSECGKNLRLAKRMDGKTITCPSCRKAIVVPSQPAEEDDEEALALPPTRLKAAKDPSAILDRLPANLPREIKELGAPVALYKGSVLFTIAMMYSGGHVNFAGPRAVDLVDHRLENHATPRLQHWLRRHPARAGYPVGRRGVARQKPPRCRLHQWLGACPWEIGGRNSLDRDRIDLAENH